MKIVFDGNLFSYGNKRSGYLFVVGPRSVGKTTLSKKIAKKLLINFFDLDEELDKELDGSGGLSKVINLEEWLLLNEAMEKVINKMVKLAKPYVMSIATGVYQYKSSDLLERYGLILGVIPYLDNKKSLGLLVKREKGREHFKQRLNNDLKTRKLTLSRIESELTVSLVITKKVSDKLLLSESYSPSELLNKAIYQLIK